MKNMLLRDMKPSNILMDCDCHVRIADFGLSRTCVEKPVSKLSEYVVTRWYRAPEIMLGCKDYGAPVDMWGVGCIFGELLCGEALFPGADYLDMVLFFCACGNVC
jgi:serine/threonine protein kinase